MFILSNVFSLLPSKCLNISCTGAPLLERDPPHPCILLTKALSKQSAPVNTFYLMWAANLSFFPRSISSWLTLSERWEPCSSMKAKKLHGHIHRNGQHHFYKTNFCLQWYIIPTGYCFLYIQRELIAYLFLPFSICVTGTEWRAVGYCQCVIFTQRPSCVPLKLRAVIPGFLLKYNINFLYLL